MKTKATFKTACLDSEGFDCARVRTAWRVTDPHLPTNNHGWFAYRVPLAPGESAWWLIEGRSGLAVQHGDTLKSTIAAFLRNEIKLMTWCGLAANRPDVDTLPLWQP